MFYPKNKNQMKNQPEKPTRKSLEKKYRNALAVFLNLATDSVNIWLKKVPNIPENIGAIDGLKNSENVEAQMQLFDAAVKHFPFLQWLYGTHSYFERPNDEAAADKNCQKLAVWMELLYDLRNYWSHVDHDEVLLSGKPLEELNDTLLELYLQACAEAKTNIPDRYKGSAGINCVELKINKDADAITQVLPKLSFTGVVFFTCLFLDGGQINNFLESMEQSCYTFDELNARMEARKNCLYMPDSEIFPKKKKDFLYARDVYRYWQLRGRRVSLVSDAAPDEKEACFGMLEYLKRCPKEAMKLCGVKQDKRGRVAFDGYKYDVREKDEDLYSS